MTEPTAEQVEASLDRVLPLLHEPRLMSAEIELTTACPCRCVTCGSNCGRAAPHELTTDELLALFEQLKALGCERLTFLGGEPLCRPDLALLVHHARACGMFPEIVTSGIGLGPDSARELRRAGVCAVTVSVDGLETNHDAQRGVPGSFRKALVAIRTLSDAKVAVGVSTQVNALSLPELETMGDVLLDAGAIGWQLQTTLPMGRAANSSLILTKRDAPALLATLRLLSMREKLAPTVTDNIGWCTSDDPRLRSTRGALPRFWAGCSAGLRHVGITSTGDVKGCLALTQGFVDGNLRRETLERIWLDRTRFAYNRGYSSASLSSACASCKHARLCRGGCIAASVAYHGRPGIQSMCLYLTELDRSLHRGP